ncbi:MFS general substrate transporter [Aaosphaeria arxii CBS 175.79]|uniref:MFS general substrate transporter n=1 Tax=Aaosphaeria arxii CBS 175.79 TaxID=1450172 RepID=A0A6A5XRV7_9PLEO|nr:MFS general substrate transporter [Aaosphaeria arxii CBS 175.79]KAF2015636.1 MFS general substrate transporter [Aaosphaeria arxii CBS 175.79]
MADRPPATVPPPGSTADEDKYESSDNGTHRQENSYDSPGDDADRAFYQKYGTYDRYEITEEDCYEELGFSFPTWKKWMILSVVFIVQVSMNFNTSLYSNAVGGISEEFGVSKQAARLGAAIFLITYAFGCELWAPWSEELGRWPILQLSLFFVNIWQIPVGIAPNFATILVCRALGGLSTAGGSVTLGMVADMWEADTQQYAVAFIVFSSVGGSVLGPIVGGFVEYNLAWRWNIWIQLIFGGAVQILHFFMVPETRTTIMMDRIAKKRRQEGEKIGKPVNIWGPNELTPFKERFSAREILITWVRPFRMFLTEPIVLVLSLLSGFSDALIFMFLQSYALVYDQWNFNAVTIGLAFIPIGIGYLLAWASFIPAIKRNIRIRHERPHDEIAQYESRLWWLLYTAPCLPIGLIGFAWTSTGPPIHWIGSMIFSAIIGIANYAIYMATIDYMICAYGPYSASATGGNGWSRDFLAGVLTLPATPFYQNIPSSSNPNHLAYASTILFCIAAILVAAVYVIYWKGPVLRKRSPFAQQLAGAREETGGRRVSALPGLYGSRHNSIANGASVPGSRRGSVVRGQSFQGRQSSM